MVLERRLVLETFHEFLKTFHEFGRLSTSS